MLVWFGLEYIVGHPVYNILVCFGLKKKMFEINIQAVSKLIYNTIQGQN